MVSHIDDDELTMMSFGEPTRPTDEEHLRECEFCQSKLKQLKVVVGTARGVTVADRPVAPPDSVWEAVVAELALTPEKPVASVTSIEVARNRRRVPSWLVATAAGVGILLGSAVTAGLILGQSEDALNSVVVARVNLEPVAGSGLQGTAAVEASGDSSTLRVSVRDLPTVSDGYYEVWMATADAGKMVALGTLNPGSDATFSLPEGMKMADFPLVDVSLERFDGNAGHSAVSVVRGQLPV
jgi:hypothetical protein